jgi:hypothetical protein
LLTRSTIRAGAASGSTRCTPHRPSQCMRCSCSRERPGYPPSGLSSTWRWTAWTASYSSGWVPGRRRSAGQAGAYAAIFRHSSAQRRQASTQTRQCSASCRPHSAAQRSQASAQAAHSSAASGPFPDMARSARDRPRLRQRRPAGMTPGRPVLGVRPLPPQSTLWSRAPPVRRARGYAPRALRLWARLGSNQRPWCYEHPALTAELRARINVETSAGTAGPELRQQVGRGRRSSVRQRNPDQRPFLSSQPVSRASCWLKRWLALQDLPDLRRLTRSQRLPSPRL